MQGREATWDCKCDCGGHAIVKLGHLRKGHTKSCGCIIGDMKRATRARQCASMIGRRFGNLVVTARANKDRYGKPAWVCRCDCGAEITTGNSNLKSDGTRSCGCAKIKIHSGDRFGLLRVVERAASKNQKSVWRCVCDCGSEAIVYGVLLRRGGTQSCGCLRRTVFESAPISHPEKVSRVRKSPVGQRAERTKRQLSLRRKLSPDELRERKRAQVRRRMAERYADPVIRMHMLIAGRLRKTLQRMGARKDARTFEMLGYSDADLKSHLERQFLSGMTWENMGKWHIDHIVPVSTATTKDDVIRLN